MVLHGRRPSVCSPDWLGHAAMIALGEVLLLLFLLRLLRLALVGILKVILRRRVVGSHGRVLQKYAEILGEVRVLNDVQTLVLVELTALVVGEHGCIIHAQELRPLLVTNLVLGGAQFGLQLELTHIILQGRKLVQLFKK